MSSDRDNPGASRITFARILLGGLFLVTQIHAKAETILFDRWKPAENIVTFQSRAPAELLIARTRSVRGILCMVGRLIAGASGEVVVETGSFASGVAQRDETMRSPDWLDAQTYPLARFVVNQLVAGETVLGVSRPVDVVAHGILEIRGVQQEIAVPASLCYMPPYLLGDPDARLFIKGKFKIDITRFGMNIPRRYIARINPDGIISIDLLARGSRVSPPERTVFPAADIPSSVTDAD